jgi:hypothetical protein
LGSSHKKKYIISLAIKEMQIKMTLRFHLTQTECLSVRKQATTNAGKDAAFIKRTPSTLLVGMVD